MILTDQQAEELEAALATAVTRAVNLSAQLNLPVASRMVADSTALRDWFISLRTTQTDPPDGEADIAELVDGIQELLPSCSVTITVLPRPKSLQE